MKNMTILVVDDDPVIRKMLEKRLEKAGYAVLIAEDGYQAEKILPQQHVDVVLTDLMMPGTIGGIEVLEIAKSLNPSIEVILITAHSSIDTAVAAMKKGAADYLEKPINFDELFLTRKNRQCSITHAQCPGYQPGHGYDRKCRLRDHSKPGDPSRRTSESAQYH